MTSLYLEICLVYIEDAIERATGRELASLTWQRDRIAERLAVMS